MKRVAIRVIMLASVMALVFFVSRGYARAASVGSRGLVFTISLPKSEFEESEAVPLKLVIKNSSQHEQTIPSLFVNAQDEPISVRSGMYLICQKGVQILAFKGATFKQAGTGHTLEPGAAYEAFELDLTKCFDLEAGAYDIQLLFTTRYSGFVDAASNRLRFRVSPKRSKEGVPLHPRTMSPASLLKRNADGTLLIAIKPRVFMDELGCTIATDEQGNDFSVMYHVIAFTLEGQRHYTIWGADPGERSPVALDPSTEYTFLVKPYREVDDKEESVRLEVLEVRHQGKLLFRKKQEPEPANPPDEE
jgi:hypothetical protein